MIYYPMAIFQDDDQTNFSGIIPDLVGCYPSANSIDELILEAKNLAEFHIEGMIAENYPFEKNPKTINEHRNNPDYSNALLWAIVAVDESAFTKQVRFNTTLNTVQAVQENARDWDIEKMVNAVIADDPEAVAIAKSLKKSLEQAKQGLIIQSYSSNSAIMEK